MSEAIQFTTPAGRLVGGSLYKQQERDGTGKNAGKKMYSYWVPVAIPKGPEQHWNQTAWGRIIWDVGVKAFGQIASAPSFAWKITDGDSAVPNKKGKLPKDNVGYPGHWILNFGGMFAPKVCNSKGDYPFIETVDYIKPGNYVQVLGSVSDNKPSESPGVYLNYLIVSLQGYHPDGEIIFGPDLREEAQKAGFGTTPLPPGASATPVGGMPVPPSQAASDSRMAGTFAAPTPAVVAVTPNMAFLAPPPAAAVQPPPPPVQAGPMMTVKANGIPYESYIAGGWTDATLRAHGYMV